MEKVNLKKWTSSMKGKDNAQEPTNVYARVQTGSGAAGPIEPQVVGTDSPRSRHCRKYAAPVVSPQRASMVSRPFLAVGINCHTKKRSDAYSERMNCCIRSAIS